MRRSRVWRWSPQSYAATDPAVHSCRRPLHNRRMKAAFTLLLLLLVAGHDHDRAARTASVTVATSATNVYVVERDDAHRLGCLVLTYDAVPTKTPVRPLSQLSTCP